MELKDALQKISPQEYNAYLTRIEIQDSYLKRIQCSSQSRSVTGQATFNFSEDIGQVSVIEEKASVELKYAVQVKEAEQVVCDLGVDFVLTYTVQGELPEEFYVIFKNYTIPLQCFPYLRELVQSMTSRMGLPSLILPLRKFLIEKPKVVSQKTA